MAYLKFLNFNISIPVGLNVCYIYFEADGTVTHNLISTSKLSISSFVSSLTVAIRLILPLFHGESFLEVIQQNKRQEFNSLDFFLLLMSLIYNKKYRNFKEVSCRTLCTLLFFLNWQKKFQKILIATFLTVFLLLNIT